MCVCVCVCVCVYVCVCVGVSVCVLRGQAIQTHVLIYTFRNAVAIMCETHGSCNGHTVDFVGNYFIHPQSWSCTVHMCLW